MGLYPLADEGIPGAVSVIRQSRHKKPLHISHIDIGQVTPRRLRQTIGKKQDFLPPEMSRVS